MTIFRIPVSQDCVRTLKDPTGDTSRRTLYALIRLSDLPELPLNPDPRIPKANGVYNAIQASAESNDGKFHSKNRGITLCVKTADFDNRTNELVLDLTQDADEDVYGIIDGGHTHKAIHAAVSNAVKLNIPKADMYPDQYVRLEIMVNIGDDYTEIAGARNYSIPLKSWGLEGYQGKFDWFLDAIGDFRKYIKIRENADEPVPIMDIVQVLAAMNPHLYPKDTPAVGSYVNAGKCLDAFVANDDPWKFHKFASISRTILTLYDHVREHWQEKYDAPDEEGRRGRMDRRAEHERRQRGRKQKLTFYFNSDSLFPLPRTIEDGFPVEKGLLFPFLASFRVLIRETADNYEWIEDPFDFFDRYGTTMVRDIMKASADANGDATRVGRDRNVYVSLYRIAENALLQMEVERLRKAVRESSNAHQ